MTPSQEAGFVVGQQYRLKADNDEGWPAGTVVTFRRDDQSGCPEFTVPKELDGDGWRYLFVSDIEPIPVIVKAASLYAVSVEANESAISVNRALTAEEVKAIIDIITK
jgi:hypothetical protein